MELVNPVLVGSQEWVDIAESVGLEELVGPVALTGLVELAPCGVN